MTLCLSNGGCLMAYFYDIHTHRSLPPAESCRRILNRIVGVDTLFPRDEKLSCGIHPWYIQEGDVQLEALKNYLDSSENIVAIGEAGLDKLHSPVSLARQQDIFHQQALLAEEYGKPLLIHCVKAWEEVLREKKSLRPSVPWILHGFRGKGELARQLLREGFCLSFGLHFQPSALREAWPERLFLETDEAEVGIGVIYREASAALGISLDELARQVEENARLCRLS